MKDSRLHCIVLDHGGQGLSGACESVGAEIVAAKASFALLEPNRTRGEEVVVKLLGDVPDNLLRLSVASLIGKRPLDINVWIMGGTAPAFVKEEGPFYLRGPDLEHSVDEPGFAAWFWILREQIRGKVRV